jgi:hypothetical protein
MAGLGKTVAVSIAVLTRQMSNKASAAQRSQNICNNDEHNLSGH